jgi:predicted Zn-dependent peptidase
MGRPILGYDRTVRSFTAQQIRRFHERSYRGSNIVMPAAGAVDPNRFIDLTSRAFRFPRGGKRWKRQPLPRLKPKSLHEERPLNRTYLVAATRGPSYRDRKRYPIYLLNLILGAGSSSRLFQRIREREGLAYAVHSFVDSYEDTGAFGIYLCLDPGNLGRTFRLLNTELGRLRRDGIKRWELSSAKAQVILMHSIAQESVSERMGRLALKEFLYGRQTPDGQVVEAIRSVTADEILQAVDRILDPGRFCLVTVGPKNGVPAGIQGLDF